MTSTKLLKKLNEERYNKKFQCEIDLSEANDGHIHYMFIDLEKIQHNHRSCSWIIDLAQIIRRQK